MNFLAHLFLSENESASRVGNLLGDFVTGRPDSLRPRFPEPILAGIVRHRQLDAWTDRHTEIRNLMAHVSPGRRRFAGAIIDVFHDGYLTLQWSRFSSQPLRTFLDECYAALLEHREHLPPELDDSLDEKIAHDWLGHYGSEEGLRETFARMSRRRPAFAILHGSMDDLLANPQVFEDAFSRFLPDAIATVKRLGPEQEGLRNLR